MPGSNGPRNEPSPREDTALESAQNTRAAKLRREKADLRSRVRKLRAALSEEERAARSEAITAHLLALPAYHSATRIHCFISLPDEVDTTGIFAACLKAGKQTFVPVVDPARDALVSIRWRLGDPLIAGPFNVPIPPPTHRISISPEDIDLVLLPGLAFDDQGNRLGYGKGYYDRLLGELAEAGRRRGRPIPPALGLAFHCQKVASVPTGEHDVACSGIITEKGWRPRKPAPEEGNLHRQ